LGTVRVVDAREGGEGDGDREVRSIRGEPLAFLSSSPASDAIGSTVITGFFGFCRTGNELYGCASEVIAVVYTPGISSYTDTLASAKLASETQKQV
jgi:hypothetical protein